MAFVIRRVPPLATRQLRQRILRPHQSIDEVGWPGDDDPETGHIAAMEDDAVIGTATVRREAAPWAPEVWPAWRLRGMATAEDRRHQGVGTAVLEAVIAHVRDHGGGLLWCSARTPAVPFYARSGFVTQGDVWEEPIIGPHIAMKLMVEPQLSTS